MKLLDEAYDEKRNKGKSCQISFSVIATIFLPKTTGLASPQIDGYNDHESIERKRASPFYDAVLPARHRECSSNKHGYYKALPT